MVQLDVMCTAIRLTPVWICLGAYLNQGHWPTCTQALLNCVEYGFSVDEFKRRPVVVLTHLFVHFNDSHLFGNLFSLTNALIEFGGSSVIDNVEERNVTVAVRRTIGSFIVFITGGVIGGIGGQLLFHDVKRYQRYGKSFIFPEEEPSTITGRLQGWVKKFNNTIEKKLNDGMFMCGASAGIFALAGFNTAYYNRWLSSLFVIIPEVAAVVSSLNSTEPPGFFGAWAPGANIVGHAAHVGGFVVGAIMGYFWKYGKKERSNKSTLLGS